MGLTGDISSIDISDVLSVISVNKKTGLLTISRGLEEKKLYFKGGRLIFSSSTSNKEKLGEVLVSNCLIDRSEIKSVVEEQKDDGSHIGTILLKKQLITQEELFKALRIQSNRILTNILNWIEGKFYFKDENVKLPDHLTIAFDLNRLIFDAAEMSDAKLNIKEELPDFNSKPQMALRFREGVEEITLKSYEWEILYLADGEKTIADICYIAGDNDLEIMSAIKNLIDRGLLVVPDIYSEEATPRYERLQKIQLSAILRLYNELFRLIHRKAYDIGKDRARGVILKAFDKISRSDESILFKDLKVKRDGSLEESILIDNLFHFSAKEWLDLIYEGFGNLIQNILQDLREEFGEEPVQEIVRTIEDVVDFLIHKNQHILAKVGIKSKIEKYMHNL